MMYLACRCGFVFVTIFASGLWFPATAQQPTTDWQPAQSAAILEKTMSVRLAPDLSHLTGGERVAVEKLLSAGEILHELYLIQKHPAALTALAQLKAGDAATVGDLQKLFWLFSGPVATTLENNRVAFLPVAAESKGKSLYPTGIMQNELDRWFSEHPETRADLLSEHSVVRRWTSENVRRYRETLDRYPLLATLHRDLDRQLEQIQPDASSFLAVPYSVEYADRLLVVFGLLNDAADVVQSDDAEFANYLRNRARDILSDDYESGDASWVTGHFKNLNAQIGSYETYDDSLYGVKSFFSMSLLARDPEKSQELAAAVQHIQSIEDQLPYEPHKKVRENIPVHVCNVIADFGQARGTNTATILPNDAEHSRKYGRTILLRYNIMTHPALYGLAADRFRLAVAPKFRNDLTLQSTFQRTMWHEVGHYLGVDKTEDGRDLGAGLQNFADLFEEMKADLVSLYSAELRHAEGETTDAELRSIYAVGILRVLQLVQPRVDQPYQTMQLIQWNYFLENGLLTYDEDKSYLSIDYEVYHRVVGQLLGEVFAIQRAGSVRRAEEFVERYTTWSPHLHDVIATRLRTAATYRYYYVQYAAMEQR